VNLSRDPERQIDDTGFETSVGGERLDDAEQPEDEDQDQQTAKTDIHDIAPMLVLRLKRF
jgi:hypothetical protein